MKYNEPIRPAGIGRKQVAFPTGNQTSELQSLEIDFNTIANDSTGSQIEARISNAIGIAKSSATAAASDAHKKSQNYPFGMIGITDFALSGLAAITTKTLIPFRTVNVLNSNFQYDARDRMIYVNEAGWYLVQCFFYSTTVQGNHDYALSLETNVGGGGFNEVYTPFMDFRSTNKHPNLNGTAIVNLPNQNGLLNQAGRYGFRIYLHGTMGFASFLNSNTQCTLNVFKLADIFEANRLFTIPV
ncbi:MAG: hypothetical protein LW818_08965 [Ignavibacteriae bacterium]|nr:hypothetical protein [Ignavibacteriota bacterium]